MAVSAQGVTGTGFEDLQRDGNRVAGADMDLAGRCPPGVSRAAICKSDTGREETFHELVVTSVQKGIRPQRCLPGSFFICGPRSLSRSAANLI